MDLWRYLSSITPSPFQPPPLMPYRESIRFCLPAGSESRGHPNYPPPPSPSPGPHRSILSREVIALGFPSSSRFYPSQLASLPWLQTGLIELCQQFARSEKWRAKSAHWLLWWSSKEVTPGLVVSWRLAPPFCHRLTHPASYAHMSVVPSLLLITLLSLFSLFLFTLSWIEQLKRGASYEQISQ